MARNTERGAVAVEFALILPVLLLLVMGIVEFGRAYNAQIAITHAAREGVRVMVIKNEIAPAKTAAKNAAVSLNPALQDSNIAIDTTNTDTTRCAPGKRANVTITYTLSTLTGIAGPLTLTGKGVMQCGG